MEPVHRIHAPEDAREPNQAEKVKGRRERFVEIAERRTANAIKAIRTLGNLANKSHYEYDEKDIKKIISALSNEVDALKHRLLNADRSKKVEFKL